MSPIASYGTSYTIFIYGANSPGQNSNKIAGDGGMKEGPHVPESARERLELDAAADTHHLMNLDVAAGRGHVMQK